MSTQRYSNVNEAMSAINSEVAGAKLRWKNQCEAVDRARTNAGLEPMNSWTKTVLSTVLETFDKRCKTVDARNTMMGRVTESTQAADVSFLRTHGINILTATMPNLIANELLSVQPLN